ncbi:substrate-binding protein [Lampropedia hyalina DSM 16112]|jgi:iron complex transport system substrate-binding protein|uniref:Substrate-binding protein n=1 Tax=Lampropedia hyalina DSM 16112 TaxID=1122156 RepID=A0A1M4WE58_9BURK|nr:ABC transporter substrate-binding protein [Lampropedia hyalina]SHE79252.1 substrate-binding protein [Lampropedia hyalina DSM 16112]
MKAFNALRHPLAALSLAVGAATLALPLAAQTRASDAPPVAAATASRTFHHAQGQTTIAAVPQRIAVLDLAALDILDGLGVEVAGVPTLEAQYWPDYLKKYSTSQFTPVGDLFQPDLEALKKLQPDLVILGGRSASKFQEVSAIAPTIDLSSGSTAFVPTVAQNILLLGRILNREPQASERAESLLRQVRELHAPARA